MQPLTTLTQLTTLHLPPTTHHPPPSTHSTTQRRRATRRFCAALDQAEAQGSGLAVLTFLGGGVFCNRPEWIEAAIARAVAAATTRASLSILTILTLPLLALLAEQLRLHHLGIRVELCHFGEVDQRAVARLESAIAAERNK